MIRKIRHDSEGSTTLGEVAFFMGIAQPEALSAVRTGDVTLLLFSKLDYEDLMAFYPEQQDIIITNLLSKYDLDKNGNDMAHVQIDQEDTHFIELRQAIQVVLSPESLTIPCQFGSKSVLSNYKTSYFRGQFRKETQMHSQQSRMQLLPGMWKLLKTSWLGVCLSIKGIMTIEQHFT